MIFKLDHIAGTALKSFILCLICIVPDLEQFEVEVALLHIKSVLYLFCEFRRDSLEWDCVFDFERAKFIPQSFLC